MSVLILVIAGIALVIAEIFFMSFFLLFLGIGLLATAGLEYLIGFEQFGNAYVWQAVSIGSIALLALIFLKKPLQVWFASSQRYDDSLQNSTLDSDNIGKIRENMVYFKGTLWAYKWDNQAESLAESFSHAARLDSSDSPQDDALKDTQDTLQTTLAEGTQVRIVSLQGNVAIIAPLHTRDA